MSTPTTTWNAERLIVPARPGDVLLTAAALGVGFQLLFWGVALGLSFPVYVAGVLLAVWVIGLRHGITPARSSVAVSATALLPRVCQ